MVPDRNIYGQGGHAGGRVGGHVSNRRQRRRAGAHRKSRKRRSLFARAIAAGGAALAIGAAYEVSAPTAQALIIRVPGFTSNGVTNSAEFHIFEGNIFNPQFGIGGAMSNNNVIGNIAVNIGNQIVNSLFDFELNFGAAATGNGNVIQVNLFSYNIFNPQFSLGANVSNNTTVNNVAMNNGNYSTTTVNGNGLPLIGGAMGNGNTVQFSFFSGNIFNPQWGAANTSNNTATTNVAIGNGNHSSTNLLGGLFGSFLFGGGNGNTFQFGLFVSNIFNPQFAFGGGNVSNNTANTNVATDNGNHSTNEISGGGLGTIVAGTTGNGNTNQVASGSGNIYNDQVNIGFAALAPSSSNNTITTGTQQGASAVGDSVVTTSTTGGDDVDISALRVADEKQSGSAASANDAGGQQSSTGPAPDPVSTTVTPDAGLPPAEAPGPNTTSGGDAGPSTTSGDGTGNGGGGDGT